MSSFPCLALDTVESPSKLISLSEDYVFVTGRWKRVASTAKFAVVPRINTVSILCDKRSMTCQETIANLFTPEEVSYLKTNLLLSNEGVYKIVEWSNQIIHAKYVTFVADFELRISVKDGFAERRYRETKARGDQTADPTIYAEWILE
jgi:hypothetical protein